MLQKNFGGVPTFASGAPYIRVKVANTKSKQKGEHDGKQYRKNGRTQAQL